MMMMMMIMVMMMITVLVVVYSTKLSIVHIVERQTEGGLVKN